MGPYNRTLKGFVHTLYHSHRGSSRKRNMAMPSYSKKELRLWLFSQPLFFILFDKWRLSNYDRMEAPSCDRIDDSKPYTFNNMELKTFRENNKKSHEDRKSGKLITSQNKAVDQYTKEGEYITTYVSIHQATRALGKKHSKICDMLKGRQQTAYGFIWKYNTGGVPLA